MSRLRVGLLGCGDIAVSGHLPALSRSGDVELIAVADVDADRAAGVAAEYGCRRAESLADLASMDLHAVVIATPPQATPHLTIEAVEARLDVLCEKPMALDLPTAERVAHAAERTGQIVQVGFKNRFSPLVRTLDGWIREGALGAPLVFTLGGFDEALDPSDGEHEQRIRGFLATAPCFVHEGAHFADYLALLTRSLPVRVSAIGQRSLPDFGNENFVSALVEYANRDVARLEIGWMFPVNPIGEFRALGPDGVAILDRPGGVVTLHRRDRSAQVRLDRPWNDLCFDLQLAHFVDCVRSRVPPETSAAAGVASLRLGQWVLRSLREAATDGN